MQIRPELARRTDLLAQIHGRREDGDLSRSRVHAHFDLVETEELAGFVSQLATGVDGARSVEEWFELAEYLLRWVGSAGERPLSEFIRQESLESLPSQSIVKEGHLEDAVAQLGWQGEEAAFGVLACVHLLTELVDFLRGEGLGECHDGSDSSLLGF